ncbi:PTS sugar transporter subunit IIA [uncultured Limosilactobacillus sp.]|uniref:BglG family transcription antiterminator n=1 Tax=uncultured Limosilactobacillus sp. TaxID=2837629 RepID=UPI0025CC2E55|nr:PTS sugar transporter subunit IIA [uncultured Limosilactobacillus sp.]
MAVKNAEKLIDYLAAAHDYVSAAKIEKQFNISRRTVFYRIDQANQLLAKLGMTSIQNERGVGYLLPEETVTAWQKRQQAQPEQNQPAVSPQKRLDAMIWSLLTRVQPQSINNLGDKLGVSRNTIIADFKRIETEYPRLQLTSTPKGHVLAGSEEAICRYVFRQLSQDNQGVIATGIDHLTFPAIDMDIAYQQLSKLEKGINARFTENAAQTIIRCLKFRMFRISLGHRVTNPDTTSEEIAAVTSGVIPEVGRLLARNGIQDTQELVFFTEIVLCSQVDVLNYVKDEFKRKMHHIARAIMLRYDQIAGTKINDNAFVNALSIHLYATYFRCRYRFTFEMPLLDAIHSKFPEMIKFVQIACRPLEIVVGSPIPTSEIALICLYFISVDDSTQTDVARFVSKSDNIQDYLNADVLLVCTSGISTSAILYATLHRQYPLINFSRSLGIENLERIMRMPNRAKLIISTANLNPDEFNIPVISVQPVLEYKDNYRIERALHQYFPQLSIGQERSLDKLMAIVKRHARLTDEEGLRAELTSYLYPLNGQENSVVPTKKRLADLLKPASIKLIDRPRDLKETIKQLCWILTDQGIADTKYYDDILSLIDRFGPYMMVSADTFLAHAAPSEHVNQVGMALGIFRQPLVIETGQGQETIRCLIVLAPGENHEHDRALAEVMGLVTNRQVFKTLLAAKDAKTAYHTISEYSYQQEEKA